ncbi:hypothetical protein [Haloarcula sp. CGMCC 1.6347]|uniref:hypothetical protein n=1 Tax=Haloarcula sp. CGMCC 1.6347 TaxID=3111455 RepID=UPI00300E9725
MKSDESFSYDGYLVFNEILSFSETESIDSLLSKCPLFEDLVNVEESPVGITKQPFTEYYPAPDIHPNSYEHDLLEEVTEVKVRNETFEKVTGLNDEGEIQELAVRSVESTDSYWVHPNFVLIRGSKSESSRAKNNFQEWTGKHNSFKSLDFDSDFLLWLFYNACHDGSISGNFKIDTLTDAKITGGKSTDFGEMNRASESEDITRSTQVLLSILTVQGELTMLGGMFNYNNNYISADISENGRIHIKANSGDIKTFSDLRRVLISVDFVRELAFIYEYWEGLQPNERYPPLEFFEDLKDRISEPGTEFELSLDPVIEKYREKRNQQ